MITIKEVKDYLQQVRKLDMLIENKQIEKRKWYELATGTTSQLSSDKVQTSGNHSRMEDAVIKIVDTEREITEQIDKFIDLKKEVISTIEQLKPVEYDILHKIYIQYMTYEQVAEKYGYQYSWATTTHGRALQNLRHILEERETSHDDIYEKQEHEN